MFGGKRQFGKYTVYQRIGFGGMAEVYRAELDGPEGFRKRVALKVLSPEYRHDRERVDMFIDEATIAAGLDHPNLIRVHDFGKQGDDYYIAMELLDGWDVGKLLTAAQRGDITISLDVALHIGRELANGLAYIHDARRGIVHRDVTPHNVFITRSGQVKLSDFGIAMAAERRTRTETGTIKGKLAYLAPEQVRGRDITARSDVYAAGLVLYELVTGKRAIHAPDDVALIQAALKPAIDPPSRHREDAGMFDAVLRRTLAIHPAERYAGGRELAAALERIPIAPLARRAFVRKIEPLVRLLDARTPAAKNTGDVVDTGANDSSVSDHAVARVSRQRDRHTDGVDPHAHMSAENHGGTVTLAPAAATRGQGVMSREQGHGVPSAVGTTRGGFSDTGGPVAVTSTRGRWIWSAVGLVAVGGLAFAWFVASPSGGRAYDLSIHSAPVAEELTTGERASVHVGEHTADASVLFGSLDRGLNAAKPDSTAPSSSGSNGGDVHATHTRPKPRPSSGRRRARSAPGRRFRTKKPDADATVRSTATTTPPGGRDTPGPDDASSSTVRGTNVNPPSSQKPLPPAKQSEPVTRKRIDRRLSVITRRLERAQMPESRRRRLEGVLRRAVQAALRGRLADADRMLSRVAGQLP